MQTYTITAVLAATNFPLPGASVTVYATGTTMKATLFDVNGSPISNPFDADQNGIGIFQVADGTYDIIASSGVYVGPTRVKVQIYDLAEFAADILSLTGLVGGGAVGFLTLAAMNANLNYAAGTIGTVFDDGTPANDGTYLKAGPNPSTVTITLATPAVFTMGSGSAPSNGTPCTLSTTGALPTGFATGTSYFVVASSGVTYELSATMGGSAINSSGSQSGVHTAGFGTWSQVSTLTLASLAAAQALLAPLASPALTGNPTAPTQSPGDSSTKIATDAFVAAAIAPLAPLASPALTGSPTAPTKSPLNNSTDIATTAYADLAVGVEATRAMAAEAAAEAGISALDADVTAIEANVVTETDRAEAAEGLLTINLASTVNKAYLGAPAVVDDPNALLNHIGGYPSFTADTSIVTQAVSGYAVRNPISGKQVLYVFVTFGQSLNLSVSGSPIATTPIYPTRALVPCDGAGGLLLHPIENGIGGLIPLIEGQAAGGGGSYNTPDVLGETLCSSFINHLIRDLDAILSPGHAVTISIANPAVVTYNNHGLFVGSAVVFETTGALPSAITAGQIYWVISFTQNTFQISTAPGGSAVSTATESQSGTQSCLIGVGAAQFACFTVQLGSQEYNTLKEGSKPYLWYTTALAQIVAWATERDMIVIVPGALWRHGESDSYYNADRFGGMMSQAQRTINYATKEITGQKQDVVLFLDQVSFSLIGRNNAGQTMMDAQRLIPRSNPFVKNCGPTYPYEHNTTTPSSLGYIHLTAIGENKCAMHFARAVLAECFGIGWRPFEPLDIYFNAAQNAIIIEVTAPVEPIVIDTSGDVSTTNQITTLGFDVWDPSGNPIAISSVTIPQNQTNNVTFTRPRISVNLASAPTVPWIRLSYANRRDGMSVTMTSASPCVVTTAVAHNLSAGMAICFNNSGGALLSPIVANEIYFVIASGLGTSTFEFSATFGGSAVNTTGSQSGTQLMATDNVTSYGSLDGPISGARGNFRDSVNHIPLYGASLSGYSGPDYNWLVPFSVRVGLEGGQ